MKPMVAAFDVDTDDPAGRGAGDSWRDHGAGVTALHAEALVAETRHQLKQGAGDTTIVPAGLATWLQILHERGSAGISRPHSP